jgi:hypothetical protein
VGPLKLTLATLGVAAGWIVGPLEAKEIVGVSIGMDLTTAEGKLKRIGIPTKQEGPGPDTFSLHINEVEVLVCAGRVVGVSRKFRGDFHTFGRLVEDEREREGEPRQSFYSEDGDAGKATSVGYIWQRPRRPVYGVHFSQFGDDYEIAEILDSPAEELNQVVESCGLSDP